MDFSPDSSLVMLTTVVTAVALLLFLHTRRLALHRKITSNMPEDLKGGSLFLCERTLTILEPIKLSGKPDEVWAREDKALVVVDTKNRKKFKTTTTDQYQLTGYALLLKYHPMAKGRKIASYGYIRIPSEAGDVFLKVRLLKEHQYHNLYGRHRLLHEGKVAARGPVSAFFCNGCGHTPECKKVYSKPN